MLKHILVVVALLATMVPCGHADMHHDHDHHDDGVAIAGEPCSCHSCEHCPGTDKFEIQTDRVSNPIVTEHLSIPDPLFSLPTTSTVLRKPLPPSVGILAALQTVQLLI